MNERESVLDLIKHRRNFLRVIIEFIYITGDGN